MCKQSKERVGWSCELKSNDGMDDIMMRLPPYVALRALEIGERQANSNAKVHEKDWK